MVRLLFLTLCLLRVNSLHYRAAALLSASPQLAESIHAAKRFRVASASSRVRALTCSCRSARVELAAGAAVGASLRLGFFVPLCCVFAGLRLIAQRHLTEPFT